MDCSALRSLIEPAYGKGISPTGRPCYDSMVLFRMELMRVWYGLSDGEIEEQVNDHLSFSRFAGLGMDDEVPDSTTLCRFRGTLARFGVYDRLLSEVNRQLESRHVMVITNSLSAIAAYCFFEKKPPIEVNFVNDEQLTLYRTHVK